MSKTEKVIIVGSGPAGLTAAIYAARANLSPFMIQGEEVGGQLTTTTDVENFPGFPDGVMGPELMDLFIKQAERFGTRFLSKNVTKVDFSTAPFKIWVDEEEHSAETVIISTGASAKYLGLENEKKYLGRGVSACATCDGAFYRDVPVCIVGGGDTAMEEALFLTRFASQVYVLHRREEFRASKIMAERVMNHPKVKVMWNTELKDILGDGKLVKKVSLYNNKTKEDSELEVEGVFIAIGHKPNTDVFEGQLKTNSVGYLETEPGTTRTNVPGVFACGDVQDDHYRQAITAAGTGCMAAMDAEKYLEAQEN